MFYERTKREKNVVEVSFLALSISNESGFGVFFGSRIFYKEK